MATKRKQKRKTTAKTKSLDFIFWGIACFWKEPGQYRVLLPDGRSNDLPGGVNPHRAEVWFRPRSVAVVPPQGWPPFDPNSFTIFQPCEMFVDGITRKDSPDDARLWGYLPSLTDADEQFRISKNPPAILQTTIDCGTLSAHQLPKQGDKPGSIYVKWQVDFTDPLTLRFGSSLFVLPVGIEQVVIANTATRGKEEDVSDYRLYRMLTERPTLELDVPLPRRKPLQDGREPDEPPHKQFSILCPFIDCSGSGYWYP
jgi:hypothetical protein